MRVDRDDIKGAKIAYVRRLARWLGALGEDRLLDDEIRVWVGKKLRAQKGGGSE